MNNSYKNTMDKIVLSSDAKQRIIKNALLHKQRKIRQIQKLKHCSTIAAGVLVCLISLTAVGEFVKAPDHNPINTAVSSETSPLPTVSPAPEAAPTEIPHPAISESPANAVPQSTPTVYPYDYSYKNEPSDASTPNINDPDDPMPQSETFVYIPPVNTGISDDTNINIPNTNHETDQNNVVTPTQTPENDVPILDQNPPGSNSNDLDTPPIAVGNPYMEFDTIEELYANLDYNVLIPQYMPEGYNIENISLLSGFLVNIDYSNGKDAINFRTAKGTEDCSGDFNIYESTDIYEINGMCITVKTDSKSGILAVWTDNGSAYSIKGDAVSHKDIIDIISSI